MHAVTVKAMHDGLAQPQSAELAVVEHDRGKVLRQLTGKALTASDGPVWVGTG